ncbi:MAG: hypothetical protein M3R15_11865, partial [Acidobacteriota bacterium]|nr:hypothetical protein [Acidobacteriota bacterium]
KKVLWSRCYAGSPGTKDTSTFYPPMTERAYSHPIPFSSVVVRHRLMDAAMKVFAKLLIPVDAHFHRWWRNNDSSQLFSY